MERLKMNVNKMNLIIMLIISIFAISAVSQTTDAKSLYTIAAINGNPTPIEAYNIQPDGTLNFQGNYSVPYYGGGAVGIAIDTDSATLFITYEFSNTIQLLDATTMTDLGTATAPSATNLAGIVMDQDKGYLYTIDRGTNDLYIYNWFPSNNTLTIKNQISLENTSKGYGIALDEINDILFIADLNTGVKYYDTDTWNFLGNFTTSHITMGGNIQSIAVDASNQYVYTGCGYSSPKILSQYDLTTETEEYIDLGGNNNTLGLGVDPSTSYIYVNVGYYISEDTIRAYDSDLNEIDSIGFQYLSPSPTDLCIPGKDISYNPLQLTKQDDVEEGNCVHPGDQINYTICFENSQSYMSIHNVTIIDDLPDELTFISATDGGIYNSENHTVTWDIGTIISESSQRCLNLITTVNNDVPFESTILNHVTIHSDEFPETTRTEETLVCTGEQEDTIPPIQTFEFGEKKITMEWYGENYTTISCTTPIWINSTDPDGVGSKNITYSLWKENNPVPGSGEFIDPIHLYTKTVHDQDENDTNPTEGEISVKFTIDESCFHEVHYQCWDYNGNTDGHRDVDFIVDCCGPDTIKQVGQPQYQENIYPNWISCETPLTFISKDECCLPNGTYVEYLEIQVYWKPNNDPNEPWAFNSSFIVYDGDENDTNPEPGRIDYNFNFLDDCFHEIWWRGVDIFGNEESWHKQKHKVDCTPPNIEKTVGDPNCEIIENKEYCITNETPIFITAVDEGCMGGVGLKSLEYRIWWNNSWTNWITIDCCESINETIYLEEECTHYLEIKAVDYLNNTMIDNETFNVDQHPPQFTKQVGDPKCGPEWETNDSLPLDYQDYFPRIEAYCVTTGTEINITAFDTPGCCPSNVTIQYKKWDASENEPLSWTTYTGNFTFDSECKHYLLIRVFDCLENGKDDMQYWDLEIFYVDDQAPDIDKGVGNPNCTIIPGEEYCITTKTPITINATNKGCCPNEILWLRYKINDGDWTTPMLPTTLTITDECTHTLTIEAWDCLGNKATDIETFHVDDSSPEITKEVKEPKIPGVFFWAMNVEADFAGSGGSNQYRFTSNWSWSAITYFEDQLGLADSMWTEDDFGLCSGDSPYEFNVTRMFDDDVIKWMVDIDPASVPSLSHSGLQLVLSADGMTPLCQIGVNSESDPLYKPYTSTGWGSATSMLPVGMEVIGGIGDTHFEIIIPKIYFMNYFWAMNVEADFAGSGGSNQYRFTSNWSWSAITYFEDQLGLADSMWTEDDFGLCSGDSPYEFNVTRMFDDDVIKWMVDIDPASVPSLSHSGLQLVLSADGMTPLCQIGVNSESDPLYKPYTSTGWGSATSMLPVGMEVIGGIGDTHFEIIIPISYFQLIPDYWINCSTEITIDAEDTGCCGNLTKLYYRINGEQWIDILDQQPYTLNMTECIHKLDIYAEDCLGNNAYHNETFYVDCTPPEINKTVGLPQCEITPNKAYCVTTETQIDVTAMDYGCINGIGLKNLSYRIWNMTHGWGKWHQSCGDTLVISFNEECKHYLEIYAEDYIGNHIIDNETFYVDETPPQLQKIVGTPHCGPDMADSIPEQYMAYFNEIESYCVNLSTMITLDTFNSGGCCDSDVFIEYKKWLASEDEPENWTIYTEPFNFTSECKHYLLVRTYDCLENGKDDANTWDLEIFYVDETGPSITKEVGDPKVKLEDDSQGHDQWMIFPETDICISINSTAPDGCCPNESGIIEYRYWYLGEWTDWTTYTDECIHLTEGCVHYLEARAIDCLGNIGPVDNETFWVCGPSGDSGPDITFIEPTFGDTRCDRTLEVIIDAEDDETDKEDLNVIMWIPGGRRDAPTLYYYPEYDPARYGDEYFHAFIDLYKYQDGAELTLQAIAQDEDMNVEMTIPQQITVCSTIVWDQWMQKGWNTLTLPINGISCNASVEHVLASVYDYVNVVYHYDGTNWTTFKPNAPWHPWTEFVTGETYWIYITKEDGLRYYTDTNDPMISIEYPFDEEEIGCESLQFDIWGNASDIETGIDTVMLTIMDNATGDYWTGSAWGNYTEHVCDYNQSTDQWICMGTKDIMLTDGQEIILHAKTYDKAGCMAETMNVFTYICEPVEECIPDVTYTTNADFNQGILTNTYAEEDSLYLNTNASNVYPTLWIANAGEDSLSKWDTTANKEVARYHTWFGPLASHGSWEGPAPSRTCVDSDGNCYVANRHFDSDKPANVIKILTNDWIDRNGNGVIDTSYDANDNGAIEPVEMLPMNDTNSNGIIDDDEIIDERIAWVATVGDDNGLGRSLSIDLDGNIWLGLYNTKEYYKLDGDDGSVLGGPYSVGTHTPYGSLVDKYGFLWGSSLSSNILKMNTSDPSDYTTYYVPSTYGIALGYDSLENTLVYVGGNYPYVVFNSSSETYTSPAYSFDYTRGVATDSEGNIVAGSNSDGSVIKYSPDNSMIWEVSGQVTSEVRGIVVDSDDNLWCVHRASNKLCKYDGTNGDPLGVYDSGLYPYTYSDATGIGFSSSFSSGKWTVIHDSQATGTMWNKISWNANVPTDTNITVKVRSSEDQISWSPWETATNDGSLSSTPNGQYIQMEVTMQSTSEESPVIYDISIDGSCADCMNIVETAVDQNPEEFNTLVEAVLAAGLDGVLSNLSQEFTVFAPVDAAFAEIDPIVLQDLVENDTTNLTNILTYHVVAGTYLSTDLTDGMELTTVQGENLSITVNGGGVFVNDAMVVLPDVVCCNGVIHAIDNVLFPPVPCERTATVTYPYYEAIDGSSGVIIEGFVQDNCECIDPDNVSIAIYYTSSIDNETYYLNESAESWQASTIVYNQLHFSEGDCNLINFSYTIPFSLYIEGASRYYIHVAAHPSLQNTGVVSSEFTVGIPANDFVGYWTFDEGSGTTVADTTGSADGAVYGFPNWTTGKMGNAIEFDETGEYVQLNNSAGVNFSGDYTWMAWIKAPTESTSTAEHKIMGRIPFSDSEAIQLHTGHGVYGFSNQLYHNIYAGTSNFRSTTDVRDDQWHFVVAVNTGSQIKIYVDGIPVEATESYSGASVSTKDMSVGSFMGSQVFNGIIDEVAILDYDLNDGEIQQCYENVMAGLNYSGE